MQGHTAAEVIFYKRKLGLTNFKRKYPTRSETEIAKNYLMKKNLIEWYQHIQMLLKLMPQIDINVNKCFSAKQIIKKIEKYYIKNVSGDTLYAIARKYNLTVDELKKLNNLTSNLLTIGQRLKVKQEETSQNYYTVQSGDSLYSIARKYNTTVDELKRLNNLTSNLLTIGQRLIIPSSQIYYTVKQGDTLYSIARNYNITVDKLKELNNLSTNTLSIGQKLIVN